MTRKTLLAAALVLVASHPVQAEELSPVVDAAAVTIGLAVALGLPGLLLFLCVVWFVSSVISDAVEAGVRRSRLP
jgi:hypothetical protein